MEEIIELDKVKHLFNIKDISKIIIKGKEIESIVFFYDKLDEKTGKRHSEIYETLELCKEVIL